MKETNASLGKALRLLGLILELQSNPRQTPEQLRRKLGIKKSTFHADKKLLETRGFGWTYSQRHKMYVREGDGSPITFELSLREALALILAIRQFAAAGDATLLIDAVEGLRKLVAHTAPAVQKLLGGTIDDILRGTFHAPPALLDEVLTAQRERREVIILYRDRDRKKTNRYRIEPYQIFFQGRALYLDAHIPDEHRIATLRVSRIQKVEAGGGFFEVRADYNFTERHRHTFRAFRSDHPPQRVKIRFSSGVADLIEESSWHPSEHKLMGTDGNVTLTLTVAEPREVLWYLIMPYAEHAEILEPLWLREEFLRIAKSVVARHEKSG